VFAQSNTGCVYLYSGKAYYDQNGNKLEKCLPQVYGKEYTTTFFNGSDRVIFANNTSITVLSLRGRQVIKGSDIMPIIEEIQTESEGAQSSNVLTAIGDLWGRVVENVNEFITTLRNGVKALVANGLMGVYRAFKDKPEYCAV
jgi:hypothetical protein